MNAITGQQNQAGIANSIYGNVMNPAMDMWNSLNNAYISELTSSQASGGGGGPSTGDIILGGLAPALPGLASDLLGGVGDFFGGLF
jgi:uncharacterized membrane protein